MRKITITLDKSAYEGLHRVIGREKMDNIKDLLRPHVDLELEYQRTAQDEARERKAFEWIEGTLIPI